VGEATHAIGDAIKLEGATQADCKLAVSKDTTGLGEQTTWCCCWARKGIMAEGEEIPWCGGELEKLEVKERAEVLHSVDPELLELGAVINTGDRNVLLNVGDSTAWSYVEFRGGIVTP